MGKTSLLLFVTLAAGAALAADSALPSDAISQQARKRSGRRTSV